MEAMAVISGVVNSVYYIVSSQPVFEVTGLLAVGLHRSLPGSTCLKGLGGLET